MKSRKVNLSSNLQHQSPAPSVDRLSGLLAHFRVQASLFHSGLLCGTNTFDAIPGRAFLHVLRRGSMQVRHPAMQGVEPVLALNEPSLLLYTRPLAHVFVNPPEEGSDFTCATLDFDGGERNPFVAALPPVVWVPLREVAGLQPALDLLFAETEKMHCGSRLIANRLFEVVLIQLLRWILDHPHKVGVSHGLILGLADARLAKTLVALHQSPGKPWSLASMAQTAAMSRSAFAAAFRQVTGMTPAAYLADWRLTLASAMIRDKRPLKLIAMELGFSSASALSRAFSQRFGMSPRQWAQMQSAPAVFMPGY
ncbi:MAG: AraC family transcriptional regulator [Alcaligenaceae bacterium]|jgi:AraC-like DNA-binding protein|nr:AraC family transcriptional regulator [Alcaligenaceae bacterium]